MKIWDVRADGDRAYIVAETQADALALARQEVWNDCEEDDISAGEVTEEEAKTIVIHVERTLAKEAAGISKPTLLAWSE